MKELSKEEKAKRYDEAIEKFGVILNLDSVKESGTIFADDVRKILPELIESEDERIRKAISQCVEDMRGQFEKLYKVHHKDAIAWLESQGEHKKFRDSIQVGDKVTRNEDGVLVNISQLKRFAKKYEKQGEQKPYSSETMNEKGDIDSGFTRMMEKEQTSAWSEEDMTVIYGLEYTVKHFYEDKDTIKWYLDWLIALKCGILSQPKQEWSEEDERLFQIIIDILDKEEHKGHLSHTDLIACVRKLKSLRPQNTWKPSETQLETLKELSHDVPTKRGIIEELLEQLKKLREE